MTNEVWAIDFEASSLSLDISYPIEVGYTNGKIKKEFMIKPCSWWWDWDPASEAIHGIPIEKLHTHGVSVYEVAEEMQKDLKDQKVWCDGGEYDIYWNSQLFNAADRKPNFTLCNIQHPKFKNIKHRAIDDAYQLWAWMYAEKIAEGINIILVREGKEIEY